MGAGGVVLRFFNLGLRVLQFLDAAVILGIFSYFLAVLSRNNQTIETWIKAVEGLAGAATAYSLLGAIFTCCLGGVAFFAFLGVALDVCFVGAMVAIAILTRKGVSQCTGTVDTPMGTGNANDDTASKGLKFGMACKLEKVVFAVAIIGIVFYLTSILFQILLARHHKREKRFGPSPTNGYTHGSRKAFWRRNKNNPEAPVGGADALPGHPTPYEVEMGDEPKTEKGWFSSWGKNKNTANGPAAAPAPGSYGYGNSAYTGNI
ncbi:unnamed protein product [Penicillium nalgiovense]|uniref:MARVEL domain-containing protein n=1 Tax=Penicillium nalgiovense TaxID=60175 RepID=A0A1V6YFI6_PENNA|nr:hypothetical protein PENNAL_c0022G08078 [Penicillium nalgiovense]CAG7966061.1 unnamed protein product [Penicillium nalgiovense]CAG7971801.1 unnamed protein product [Penicillium nalgiovense]CAG8022837.1 unnamed protein product [Penicillium nalgiovense]CAG8030284.1 unnamed protein product [Penicillium nalgiovense]